MQCSERSSPLRVYAFLSVYFPNENFISTSSVFPFSVVSHNIWAFQNVLHEVMRIPLCFIWNAQNYCNLCTSIRQTFERIWWWTGFTSCNSCNVLSVHIFHIELNAKTHTQTGTRWSEACAKKIHTRRAATKRKKNCFLLYLSRYIHCTCMRMSISDFAKAPTIWGLFIFFCCPCILRLSYLLCAFCK